MTYEFSTEELAKIAAAQRRRGSLDCWDDEEITPIRQSMKRHYIEIQERICAYCKKTYDVGHLAAWSLDHIIPRETFPEFTFRPENLAATCLDCNTYKSNRPVLVGTRRPVNPPRTSAKYMIVHPWVDNYRNHIVRRGEYFYDSRSPKGDYTIYICRLSRFFSRQLGFEDDAIEDQFFRLLGDLAGGDWESKHLAAHTLLGFIQGKRQEQLMQQAVENALAATEANGPRQLGGGAALATIGLLPPPNE
ncbi:MAG: HNH endonuclease signature motif containing protein [Phenylobacterium sp.]|uniref:HNH endonuclease n=1 Tax=Phenylobacterium sp. TaxID=1871053 RepID=UPI0027321394|nr:HNH endonuclease signature motif containing protein [Phenylobacterium sp.]MDP2009886.1 HNH endonuclease signature motif containing protein [Phenylobacterium sp.]